MFAAFFQLARQQFRYRKNTVPASGQRDHKRCANREAYFERQTDGYVLPRARKKSSPLLYNITATVRVGTEIVCTAR